MGSKSVLSFTVVNTFSVPTEASAVIASFELSVPTDASVRGVASDRDNPFD